MNTILKATSKGQITLPAKWRKNFSTVNFVARENGDILEIRPIEINNLGKEYTVFDAIRDNKGKGIKAEDLVKILKSI
jgi:bifunctional DNA-binding transcriptional regulator/antitoxin component of YhaV-PrlF toxin-antitoxin module